MSAYHRNKPGKWIYVLLPIAIITAVLCYYGLFSTSKQVAGKIKKAETIFRAHTGKLRGVRFTPDENLVTASIDSTVRIWKRDGQVIRTLKHPAAIASMDISPDGNYIATGSYDNTVRLWRTS